MREALPLLLALAYGFAAGTKRHQTHAFVSYLRPVAGRHATAAVQAVLCAEAALVALTVAALAGGPVAATAGASSALFLAFATSVYAILIVKGESSQCQCFRIRYGARSERDVPNPMAAPLLCLRNTALLAASLWVARVPGLVLIGSASAIPLLVATGLTISVTIQVWG